MILIGTAGHVDHGKSALVEALTGIDPVHLPEEKERGLTIELGFAHLEHPDGYTLGIVDVPGHEKLVRTMVSGATGFGLALWVVDAREGLMPQSVEHLEVLELLGDAAILPVVTKVDLASEDELRKTRRMVEDALSRSRLVHFPVRLVDSLSGRGIPELREALFAACRSIARDPSKLDAPAYMPIDRCFVLKGVGAVVTGTLVRGRLETGAQIEVSSSPESWRIRSLHNHSTQVDNIGAGHRVGVHLHGIRADAIDRGDVLVAHDYPYRSDRINVELRLLEGKAFRLKHGLRALFLAASYEMECRLWGFAESSRGLWVQVQLPRETCFYPGQRFILRSTNPLATVGGGTIVDLYPDRARRITDGERRFYETGDLVAYVGTSPAAIFEASELETRWMRPEGSLFEEARASDVLRVTPARLGRRDVGLLWHRNLEQRALAEIDARVRETERRPAEWPLSSLARALGVRTVYARTLLERCLELDEAGRFRGLLKVGPNTLRYDPERGGLSAAERRVRDALIEKLRADSLRPNRLVEYARSSGADRKTFDKATASLLKEEAAIRIDNEFVLAGEAWADLRRGLMTFPAEGVTPAEFGRHFDITRKYSMPYLECLNRMGLMRREGNRHVVVHDRVARGLNPDAR